MRNGLTKYGHPVKKRDLTPRMQAALADYQNTTMTLVEVCAKHNVTRRGMGINLTRMGLNRYNWTRGYTLSSKGYALRYVSDHPFPRNRKSKQLLEHIRLMEIALGRRLAPNECVHHKDENRSNNDMGNLQLMTKGDHVRLHAALRRERKALLAAA